MSDLKDGRYRARAIDGNFGRSSKGTDQVVILFELESGHRRTWYGYLSDAAVDRTLEALRACGVTELESLAGLGSCEVEIVLATELFEGKQNQRIAFVNALGSGSVKLKAPMSDGDRKAMAARLKGKWLAGQPLPPVETPTGTDDDIPF